MQRRGFCPFNQNCRYSHRCSVCGDSRHNSSNCRKQTNVTSSYGSTPPYTYKNNTHQPYTFGTAHNSTFSLTTKGNARQYYTTLDLPTPIKVNRLAKLLEGYDCIKTQYLIKGFSSGFELAFEGIRVPHFSKNSDSRNKNSKIVQDKLEKEIALGRIAGSFESPQLKNFQVSPLAVLPKRSPG